MPLIISFILLAHAKHQTPPSFNDLSQMPVRYLTKLNKIANSTHRGPHSTQASRRQHCLTVVDANALFFPEHSRLTNHLKQHCDTIEHRHSTLTDFLDFVIFGQFGVPLASIESNRARTQAYSHFYLPLQRCPHTTVLIKDLHIDTISLLTQPAPSSLYRLMRQGRMHEIAHDDQVFDREEIQELSHAMTLKFSSPHQVRIIYTPDRLDRFDISIHVNGRTIRHANLDEFFSIYQNAHGFITPNICFFQRFLTEDRTILAYAVESESDKLAIRSRMAIRELPEAPIHIIHPSVATERSGRSPRPL